MSVPVRKICAHAIVQEFGEVIIQRLIIPDQSIDMHVLTFMAIHPCAGCRTSSQGVERTCSSRGGMGLVGLQLDEGRDNWGDQQGQGAHRGAAAAAG